MYSLRKTLKHINPTVLHVLCWAMFILINVSTFYNRFSLFPDTLFYGKLAVEILLFYINYSLLVPKLLLNKKIALYVLAAFVFILLSVYLMELFFNPTNFPHNLEPLKHQPDFRPRKRGVVNRLGLLVSVLLIAVGTSIRLVVEWYENDKLKQQIEVQRVHTEISFLKAQLNPHFLFNSLNSIYSLANKKSDDTTEAIVTLSELMRYMIYETDKDLVPLQNEITYIKNYISLQNLRLKDSSGVRVNIYGKIEHKIEPLLLISFIENAFKYGTDYNGKTDIRIRIEVIEDQLFFEVSNYVSIYNRDTQNSGIGIKNVKNRLLLQYPNTHELEINEQEKQFSVKLKLKLKTR